MRSSPDWLHFWEVIYMRINMAVKMMALLGVTILFMSNHTADVKAETVVSAESAIAGM